MLGGHKADAATWVDGGGLVTSSVYGTLPFLEDYAKAHPIKEDYGKTWTLSLPKSAYKYDERATGAVAPGGWDLSFPHPLRGKSAGNEPDDAFYFQWSTSPYADTYLTKLAENAIDQLGLGKGGGIDYLGVSYSSPDYVGTHLARAAGKFRTLTSVWTRIWANYSRISTQKSALEITSWRSARITASFLFRKTRRNRASMLVFCTCRRCSKKSKTH